MGRMISRNDTALHRNTNDRNHPIARGARLARHLVFAAWRPLRALDALLLEIDRTKWPGDPAIVLQARLARDGGWPYLEDQEGDAWR